MTLALKAFAKLIAYIEALCAAGEKVGSYKNSFHNCLFLFKTNKRSPAVR
jgi:hypothetical protein